MQFLNNLGEGAQSLYNRFFGPNDPAAQSASEIPQNVQPSAPEQEPLHTDSDDDEAVEQNPAMDSNPKQASNVQQAPGVQGPSRKTSVMEDLMALHQEAMGYCEAKVKKERDVLQELQDSTALFNRILEKISLQRGAAGDLDASNDKELQQLLKNAKNMGMEIPKDAKGNTLTRFTKDQTDSLVRAIEARMKSIDTKMRLQIDAVEEALKRRTTFFEVLKNCADKLAEVIKKIFGFIASSGR